VKSNNSLNGQLPPMMSEAGEKLAKRTPPQHRYTDTKIRESELFRATDAMALVFDEPEGVGHRLHRQLDRILSHVSEEDARRVAAEAEAAMRRAAILRRNPYASRRSRGFDRPVDA
jgi:hypothetical protein